MLKADYENKLKEQEEFDNDMKVINGAVIDKFREIFDSIEKLRNKDIGILCDGFTLYIKQDGKYGELLKNILNKYEIDDKYIEFGYNYCGNEKIKTDIYYKGSKVDFKNKYVVPNNYRKPTFVDMLREVNKQKSSVVDIIELETSYEEGE